jgi:hypothetical protein
MPRALATHALHYPVAERAGVLDGLRSRREVLRTHGCNYWVFEDAANPGILVEFLEGPSAAVLVDARRAVGDPRADAAPLTEVEF